MLLLAAHISRSGTLTEWLDPSVTDERDPDARDPAWNLYNPACVQPPYPADWLTEFRARQQARNRRITAWAQARLTTLKAAQGPNAEQAFVVHGTMADPRWLDPAIDPNDRVPGQCYLGDPRVINDSPGGLGRTSTLRSWLSQWGLDTSNADGPACAVDCHVPTLVVGNSADDACTPSHTHREIALEAMAAGAVDVMFKSQAAYSADGMVSLLGETLKQAARVDVRGKAHLWTDSARGAQLAALSREIGRTVRLQVPDLAPTWVVEIAYSLRAADDTTFDGVVQGTIHALEDITRSTRPTLRRRP
jgi:hypothetical protein